MVCFKIYSKIYNWFANELLLVLKEFSKLDISTFYSDYYKAYDRLADYRIKCSKNEFANNHTKGIKNFLDMLNVDYINLIDKENFTLY